MQILLENGYVSSNALVGTLTGGMEVPDPPDIDRFEERYTAYRLKDGLLEYDEKQNSENERKALCDELRKRRETECFSYVNRGQPWYDGWLKVTETLTVPERPSWLY